MRLIVATMIFAATLTTLPAAAQMPTGKGPGAVELTALNSAISEIERQIIKSYFKEQDRSDARHGKRRAKHNAKYKAKGAKRDLKAKCNVEAKYASGAKYKAKVEYKAKGAMPPGLAMQLARFCTLPPGLAKRDLPPGLRSKLPKREGGRDFVIVDEDVVLVDAATNVIIDILAGVIAQ